MQGVHALEWPRKFRQREWEWERWGDWVNSYEQSMTVALYLLLCENITTNKQHSKVRNEFQHGKDGHWISYSHTGVWCRPHLRVAEKTTLGHLGTLAAFKKVQIHAASMRNSALELFTCPIAWLQVIHCLYCTIITYAWFFLDSRIDINIRIRSRWKHECIFSEITTKHCKERHREDFIFVPVIR